MITKTVTKKLNKMYMDALVQRCTGFDDTTCHVLHEELMIRTREKLESIKRTWLSDQSGVRITQA